MPEMVHSVSHRRHIDQLFRRRRAAWRVCTMAAFSPGPYCCRQQQTRACGRRIRVARARGAKTTQGCKGAPLECFLLALPASVLMPLSSALASPKSTRS